MMTHCPNCWNQGIWFKSEGMVFFYKCDKCGEDWVTTVEVEEDLV